MVDIYNGVPVIQYYEGYEPIICTTSFCNAHDFTIGNVRGVCNLHDFINAQNQSNSVDAPTDRIAEVLEKLSVEIGRFSTTIALLQDSAPKSSNANPTYNNPKPKPTPQEKPQVRGGVPLVKRGGEQQ